MTNANHVLATLADPTRRALVERLRDGPLTVGELTKATTVTRSAVSQHLGVLRAAALVLERREGTRRYYSLDPAALGELRRYVDGLWTDALASFAQTSPED
jgi:DNA-binding transcriptional ArsR family regulator